MEENDAFGAWKFNNKMFMEFIERTSGEIGITLRKNESPKEPVNAVQRRPRAQAPRATS